MIVHRHGEPLGEGESKTQQVDVDPHISPESTRLTNYEDLPSFAELKAHLSGDSSMDERVAIIGAIAKERQDALRRLGTDVYGEPKSRRGRDLMRDVEDIGESIDQDLLNAAKYGEPTLTRRCLSSTNPLIAQLLYGALETEQDFKPNLVFAFGIIPMLSYKNLTRDNMISPAAKKLWDILESKCLVFRFERDKVIIDVP